MSTRYTVVVSDAPTRAAGNRLLAHGATVVLLVACGCAGQGEREAPRDVGPPNAELMAQIDDFRQHYLDQERSTRAGAGQFRYNRRGPGGEHLVMFLAPATSITTRGGNPQRIEVSVDIASSAQPRPYDVGPSAPATPKEGRFSPDDEVRIITDGPLRNWGMVVMRDPRGRLSRVQLIEPREFYTRVEH